MGRIPTKQMRKAVMYLADKNFTSTTFGRGWELTRDESVWSLKHYGTRIITVDMRDGTWKSEGGWSASDRDGINSLVQLIGAGPTARIWKGQLVLTNDLGQLF